MTPSVLFSPQAGEERLHHRQVYWETLRQEEMSRYDVAAPHIVRRSEGPGHILPHPGVRWGSRPHGAHPSGQWTRQCLFINSFFFNLLSQGSIFENFILSDDLFVILCCILLPRFSAHSSYCQGCYKRVCTSFPFMTGTRGDSASSRGQTGGQNFSPHRRLPHSEQVMNARKPQTMSLCICASLHLDNVLEWVLTLQETHLHKIQTNFLNDRGYPDPLIPHFFLRLNDRFSPFCDRGVFKCHLKHFPNCKNTKYKNSKITPDRSEFRVFALEAGRQLSDAS